MTITRELAEYAVSASWRDLPSDVRHEAARALVNYVGCAAGGCLHPAVDAALAALGPYSGPPTAAVLGRSERLDPLNASLMNGISSHVNDYDDTTPSNYVHPTSPVASALFPFVCANRVSGRDFVHAFVLGFEATTRIGDAVFPAHYDAGWHITGTAGVFGAAVAVGRLIGLSVQQMVWAIGLSATQAAGVREMFGSMGKAFHPGRAAQNGYSAALLAQAGFTAGEFALEGPRGFAAVQASSYDLSRITEGLGQDFGLRKNAYKPFPCGIVNHPTIDACIQLRNEHRLEAGDIAAVRLSVAPLVLDLCNKRDISWGLEGKFSVFHAAAVGLARGKAGLQEYTDEAVNDPIIKSLRERVTARRDETRTEDGVEVEIELADGRKLVKRLAHSLGNLARPMSDHDLSEKFRDQARIVLSEQQLEDLLSLTWKVEAIEDMSELIAATVPAGPAELTG